MKSKEVYICNLLAVCVLGSPSMVQSEETLVTDSTKVAIRDGLEYLSNRQNDDGSFGSSPQSRDVGVCSLCGLAFIAQGSTPGRGRYGDQIAKCVEYVLSCRDSAGFISSNEDAVRPMYGHGFATLFLSDVYGMANKYAVRENLAKAVEVILRSQNDDGGWRYHPVRSDADVSVTVGQVMALRAARNAGLYVPEMNMRKALDYLKKCQNSDGGFAYQQTSGPSTFARSAGALAAFYCVGDRESDEFKNALRFVSQFNLDGNRNADQEYFYYGHYYAAFSMLQSGRKEIDRWYPGIRNELLRRRNTTNGAWENKVWSSEYTTSVATIILQTPLGRLPIFER